MKKAMAMTVQSMKNNCCKMMSIHEYINIQLIQYGEQRYSLPKAISRQSWKDWLKYENLPKYQSCRVAVATQNYKWMEIAEDAIYDT